MGSGVDLRDSVRVKGSAAGDAGIDFLIKAVVKNMVRRQRDFLNGKVLRGGTERKPWKRDAG